MGRKAKDMTGKVIGRITVVVRDPREFRDKAGQSRPRWFCQCACGNVILRLGEDLRRSNRLAETYSCGCTGGNRATHGMCDRRAYYAWNNMRRRCHDETHAKYHRYGGRGIEVCHSWNESFTNFYNDMGDPPERHSLGRRDNDGNYEPGNCRWETPKQQSNNTSQTKLLTFNGVTKNMSEWGRSVGGNVDSVAKRIRRGWSVERAVTTMIKSTILQEK